MIPISLFQFSHAEHLFYFQVHGTFYCIRWETFDSKKWRYSTRIYSAKEKDGQYEPIGEKFTGLIPTKINSIDILKPFINEKTGSCSTSAGKGI